MTRRTSLAALLAGAVLLAGCMASDPVAPEARDVKTREQTAQWKPAEAASIPGLYRSGTIEGEAAAALLQVVYYFGEDGAYTGAALVASDPPAFQVLDGRWQFSGGLLSLGGDSEPARLEEAEGMLRLTTSEGTVVLYRDEIR